MADTDRLDPLRLLRDIHARCTRAREALSDGDPSLADWILDDLADDLWRSIERLEPGTTTR